MTFTRSLIILGFLLFPLTVNLSFMTPSHMPAEANSSGKPTTLRKDRQSAPKRLALVIGIDDYPESPLRLPVKDAELVAKQLEAAGFEVVLRRNPTLGELIEIRDYFIKKISASGENVTALFFFAGHAVQFDGHNYLIPSKSGLLANSGSKAAFIDRGMDAQLGILNYLNESKASKVVFVLDACRTNPFQPDHRAGVRVQGLAAMDAKSGGPDTFILFAAEPGQVAFDGDSGASNSPFTQAFAYAISQPGSTLEAVYRKVNDRVKLATNGKQRPYQEGVLFSFMFNEVPIISSQTGSLGQVKVLETGWERRQYDVIKDGSELVRKLLKVKPITDIQKAAESNDPEAQYLLGIAHHVGIGVTKDSERAANWLRRSATRGFSRAQFAYGQRLYWGWGEIQPSKREGFDWWILAAENGNASAMLEIGNTYQYGREGVPKKDLDQSEKYYIQALSAGHTEAETQLGGLYEARAVQAKADGNQKLFEQANEKKFAYFQQASKKGSADAMHRLADMYRYGDHVKPDLVQATQWYQKATIAGNVGSAENLGGIYSSEEGAKLVSSPLDEAVKYLRIAIDLGSETAGMALADMIGSGKATPKVPGEIFQLYEQALAKGSVRAASSISGLYLKGDLAKKDLRKAEQYALKALELFKKAKPDSEDAWPMYQRQAAYNLLKLYKEEGLQASTPKLTDELFAQIGSLNPSMKQFTVPITCGASISPFNIYIWDWKLDHTPTDAQFSWVEKARGCKVPKDVVESFQKLYEIAKKENVSFMELAVYALKKQSPSESQSSKGKK